MGKKSWDRTELACLVQWLWLWSAIRYILFLDPYKLKFHGMTRIPSVIQSNNFYPQSVKLISCPNTSLVVKDSRFKHGFRSELHNVRAAILPVCYLTLLCYSLYIVKVGQYSIYSWSLISDFPSERLNQFIFLTLVYSYFIYCFSKPTLFIFLIFNNLIGE